MRMGHWWGPVGVMRSSRPKGVTWGEGPLSPLSTMTRTHKGQKGPGYEYWQTRISKWLRSPGSWTKRATNRILRRTRKQKDKEQCPRRI